jgi:hypothetical protein
LKNLSHDFSIKVQNILNSKVKCSIKNRFHSKFEIVNFIFLFSLVFSLLKSLSKHLFRTS